MAKQTKLVDCGSTVFIYDFNTRYRLKELNFEKKQITNLQRLLLTNFVDNRLLATFTLKMSLNEYNNAQSRFASFINQLKKSSGYPNIQYLAVSELPTEANDESIVYIHLVTNLEIHSLTAGSHETISNEQEEEYFEELWGDEVFIESLGKNKLLCTFISAYNKSITSNMYNDLTKIIFKSRLLHPNILWHEEADDFIKNHNLVDYPKHKSNEIFDKVGGLVIVNEYSTL